MTAGPDSTAEQVVHLDAAGDSRCSPGVIAAQVAHLHREAATGGYAAERRRQPALEALRRRLAGLVGIDDAGVALVENATRAFADLLAAWPLEPGQSIGTLRSEYGSNRMALEALAHRRGLRLVELDTDDDGRLRVEALDQLLPRLALVSFPVIASQRGVVQPADEVAAACRRAGVPLVLDVAQAAGHVDLRAVRADAVVGTSRKWLRGPRGVGFVVVNRSLAEGLVPPFPNLSSAVWAAPVATPAPGAARLETGGERPVAALLGLGAALEELEEAGITSVAHRIATLGRRARSRLAGVAGWQVLEPIDEPSGIVTLRHERLAPEDAQRALLHQSILTSAIPVARAPRDMAAAVLRASFHTYTDDSDLEALAEALAGLEDRAPLVARH